MHVVMITDKDGTVETFGPVISQEQAAKMGEFLVQNRDEDGEWQYTVLQLQDLSEFFMELMKYRM